MLRSGYLYADPPAGGRCGPSVIYAHAAAVIRLKRRTPDERARKIIREHDVAIEEIAELGGVEHDVCGGGSASREFATLQMPGILHR